MASRTADIKAIEQAEAEHEFREAQAEAGFASEVLKRRIDWQLYANEGKLSAKDCNLILSYDQQDPQTQADVLDERGPLLAGLFIKILNTVSNIETIEYTIVLIDQLFNSDRTPDQVKTACGYFLTYARDHPEIDIASPFLQILTTNGQHNPFSFLRVQHILAVLLAGFYSTTNVRDDSPLRLTVVQFLRYLISKISTLSSSSPAPGFSVSSFSSPSSPTSAAAANRELMTCLASLKILLKAADKIQQLFAEQDGVRAIANLLNKETQNAQLLYIVGFNIWILSYNKAIAMKLKEFGCIKKLVSVVKVNVMEKVIRISFSILRVSHTEQYHRQAHYVSAIAKNFLDHKVDSFNEDMIGNGLVSVVETLSKRKFKDPDIANDMNAIQEVLYETIRNMSTFEKYSVEVTSGALSWTNPAHKNEIFWRENITQFEQKNFALVQQLIKLAEPAGAAGGAVLGAAEREETIREVACYDLGEFARFHPEGKKVLLKLRGKDVLMKNLQDKSPKISKAALLATQKLMVANWEMLNKNSSGGVAAIVSQKK